MQLKFPDWIKSKLPAWDFRKIFEDDFHDSEKHQSRGQSLLAAIAKKVKKIEITTRKRAEMQLVGQYKSRFRGQGMQFSDVRVYQYGDDVRHIDWRTSARSQQTYIKTFEEERELNIILAADISASNTFGSSTANKRETIAMAFASIAFSAALNRDQVGLLLFTDKIERYVPTQKGKRHVLRIIDEIVNFRPTNRKTDLSIALKTIPHLVRHTAVVFLASDFNGPINKNQLKRLALKHDVIAVHVTDPRELEIPNVGLIQVQDPETDETRILDTGSSSHRQKFSAKQLEWHNSIDDFLRSAGASVIRLSTDRDPAQDIRGFFSSRKTSAR